MFVLAVCWLPVDSLLAQGTGPNANILTPVGMKTLTINGSGINSNFRFGQTLIGSANFDTDTVAMSYAQRFEWLDRFAMFGVSAGYSQIDAHLAAQVQAAEPELRLNVRESGMNDPSAFLRLGLVGAPALTLPEWLEFPQGYQLYAQLGVQAPWGDYSDTRRLNTGYNRWNWDLSLPMAMPLERARRRTFLELTPRYVWFGDNDDPFGDASIKAQDDLFLLEADVLHHLSGKTWMGLSVQYQVGGETVTDGVADDNGVEQWYGELSVGHALSRQLALTLKYGKLFEVSNNARGEVLRLGLLVIL